MHFIAIPIVPQAISRVFQVGRPDGIPRNAAPKLVGIQEQVL